MTRPSHRMLVELAEQVAKEYSDAADWKDARHRLFNMATDALATLKSEGAVDEAARRGGDTIHTDSGRTPPPHNPGGFPQ